MGDCLHTSADSLSKLVKWAHSHGTICSLIPNLKHLLTEGAHGNLTALWGCGAGHAYHWPLTTSCKMVHKDRLCYERSSRGIGSESLIQGSVSMQSSSTPRFHTSAGKTSKGDSNQTRDSYDFSNCSEPSEMDDNTEEHLFDIVCESSATDEEGDSEPRITPGKQSTKGPRSDSSNEPGAKKIKQERAEDYYTVANTQAQATSEGALPCSFSLSPKHTGQIGPSSRSSAPHNSQLLEDGDLVGVSSSPLENSLSSVTKHTPVNSSQSRTHMNSHLNSATNQSTSSLSQPGRSDMVEVLPNGDFSLPFEDPSGVEHPEIDILAAQSLSTEPKDDTVIVVNVAVMWFELNPVLNLIAGCLNSEEPFWPSTSELCPDTESHSEVRKQLEDYITSVDFATLRNLQGVISRVLRVHEQNRMQARSPPRPGDQELFPGSGLFLPPYKLACIHQESRQDSMRLFHLLFEHFFTEEDLIGAVAFGKRGKVPDGKKILDRRKVDGIISYILRCSAMDGWTPVESAKLKKACINKCRLRIGQRKKLAQESYLFHKSDKRRVSSSSQMEAGSSHQLISSFPDEGAQFESPALFDSFEEVELHPLDRQRTIKISSKRNRDGENTRVRMKNVVGVIARYMTALQEFRRSVSMKVAFDRVGVDRNTISRTAAIAELSLAAPEVFHALPPWDEKEETLAHYAVRCRQAMDENIKAKIKAMKARGELLPIVSK
ncbi:hypothetical protein Baya_16870 [Bagarius yarrelli]|uniref:Coiled-coil domain-containing protein 106 n=1 Tax=Bagarius yarrelli TaxID=175774 RepID=A0A556VWV0_BAGYA|nr:hypothetical protein Baya_16870 [Bagarius yarrelli]